MSPPNRHALILPIQSVGAPPNRHALTLRIAALSNDARSTQAQSSSASARFIATVVASATSAQSQTQDAQLRVLVSRRYLTSQAQAQWQTGEVRDLQCASPWSNGTAADAQAALTMQPATPIDLTLALAWAATQRVDAQRAIALSKAAPLAQQMGLPWRSAVRVNAEAAAHWRTAQRSDGLPTALPWRNPPARDQQRTLRWQPAAPRDHQIWLAAGKATARDTQRSLVWQNVDAVLWVYLLRPPTPPVVTPEIRHCYQPPARRFVRFQLGGPPLATPRDRHALAFNLACITPRRFDLRSTLHMSHTLSVVRLPDRLPLAVRSVSLASDRDSWDWSVQIGFADAASLVAVEPTPLGLASVEVTLDGHVFTAQIEGYTEDRSFAQRGGSVSARSRSVQLAAPNVAERAYTNPAPATAQQLALRELEFSGFDLDWRIADWPVPAGAWAYDRETPVSALIRIATAAGAMLQSAPDADTLIVAPRLPAMPWSFDAETPSFTLAGGSWLRKGKRWNGGGRYNGVYVSGREQGVLARVYRDGTSGEPYAQLVIDPLITDASPARGRGGQILADSLPRHEIPIELPLTPFGSAPGLLLPGELGQIEDVVWGDYRALVDSVQISAEVSAEGLVTARQSASLWRYLP